MYSKKPDGIAQYWDNIYYKPEKELNWYEPVPVTSISLIDQPALPKDAAIIDVGGGDGTLARHLVALGYENITVLDVSSRALEIGKRRLGEMASGIQWIHSNILDFEPPHQYALWHDRASFHFLVQKEEQLAYMRKAYTSLLPAGQLILSTFSDKGPAQCSGLPVQRYTEASMTALLKSLFKRNKSLVRQHITPAHTLQEFIYCRFTKI
jgi:ubiquinone/menaquinone biosynthesis C-methylase UbiE